MTGRVMIVTGASSGLGYEVAKYLAEGGNDIIVACRSSENGDEAVTRIKQLFPNSLVQYMQVLCLINFIMSNCTEFSYSL